MIGTAATTEGVSVFKVSTHLTADQETEQIKLRAQTQEAQLPHKFQAAEWTHPNGHPRCRICGCEETIEGTCPGLRAEPVRFGPGAAGSKIAMVSTSEGLQVAKFNPHHDARGRFASRAGAGSELQVIPGAGREVGVKALGTTLESGTLVIASRGGDRALAKQNIETLNDALSQVPSEHAAGIRMIDMDSGSGWLGSASYVHMDRGPEVWVDGARFASKTAAGRRHSLVHEIGHHVQHRTGTQMFTDFKRAGLGKHFSSLTGEYARSYPVKHRNGEAFAESYARYFTNRSGLRSSHPDMHQFWSERLG